MRLKRLSVVFIAAVTVLSSCGGAKDSSSRQRNGMDPDISSLPIDADTTTTTQPQQRQSGPIDTTSSVPTDIGSTIPSSSTSVVSGSTTTEVGFRKAWIAFRWMSTDTGAKEDTLSLSYAKPDGTNVAGKVEVRIAGTTEIITSFDAGADTVSKEIVIPDFTKATKFEFATKISTRSLLTLSQMRI